jgi:hypothetical protein
MEEIMKELDATYRMVSNLTVSGDNVDLVAAVRSKLRKIASSINELNEAAKANESCSTEEV